MTNKDYEEKEFFEEIFQEEVQEEQQEEVVEEEIVKPKKSSRKKKNSFEDTFIIPTEKLLPNRLPIIPIQGHPFFPGIFTPLILSEKDDIQSSMWRGPRRFRKQREVRGWMIGSERRCSSTSTTRSRLSVKSFLRLGCDPLRRGCSRSRKLSRTLNRSARNVGNQLQVSLG